MLIILAALAATAFAPREPAPSAQQIPTEYAAGRFFASPRFASGGRLKLLVDTGGGGVQGMYWASTAAGDRLRLKVRSCDLGTVSLTVADVPAYAPGQGLPPPADGACGNAMLIQNVVHDYGMGDGQLGAGYLPGRVWTFDYPQRALRTEAPGWRPDPAAHAAKLGFQHTSSGRLANGFPRITIRVGGAPVEMLLDTGATSHPSAAGAVAERQPLADGYGAASYIDAHVFRRWHAAHPDWRIIRAGDDLFGPANATAIIEVPRVDIAGWSVGPVWFTERPDAAFREGPRSMTTYMGQAVDGAVGGNVFRHFVMTIDYPRATAYFTCATGCAAAAPGHR